LPPPAASRSEVGWWGRRGPALRAPGLRAFPPCNCHCSGHVAKGPGLEHTLHPAPRPQAEALTKSTPRRAFFPTGHGEQPHPEPAHARPAAPRRFHCPHRTRRRAGRTGKGKGKTSIGPCDRGTSPRSLGLRSPGSAGRAPRAAAETRGRRHAASQPASDKLLPGKPPELPAIRRPLPITKAIIDCLWNLPHRTRRRAGRSTAPSTPPAR
jgi:hypothetical protein